MLGGRTGWEFQGAHTQQNSGQALQSYTFSTQNLFDPFIIVVSDIT